MAQRLEKSSLLKFYLFCTEQDSRWYPKFEAVWTQSGHSIASMAEEINAYGPGGPLYDAAGIMDAGRAAGIIVPLQMFVPAKVKAGDGTIRPDGTFRWADKFCGEFANFNKP
jgi:hypothetical protein